MAKRLIVADENIPDVRAAFGALGEIRTLPGRALRRRDLDGADVLLVRSVTRVDRALLEGSAVAFVGSATIGTDHLDLDYLRQRGIAVANAPGSNAAAVVDYVLSSFCALDGVLEGLLDGGVVGIIGLGNVGGRLLRRLRGLGIRCVGYDPLLAPRADLPLCDLEAVLGADVICCHTPLTTGGPHPTRHLLDEARLRGLRRGALLLNAGRGAVIDNAALLRVLRERPDLRAVLDVWEGEPAIDRRLLQRAAIGTPHIAGYSWDGKLAGMRMILEACCRYLREPVPPLAAPAAPPPLTIDSGLSGAALLRAAVLAACDVRADDGRLRAAQAPDAPHAIDRIRMD
jgi:erythronate-4-phosphate dehydrogenase